MQIWTLQLIFSRIYDLPIFDPKSRDILRFFLAKLRTFIVLDTDVKKNNYVHNILMLLYIKKDVKGTYSMMTMASVTIVTYCYWFLTVDNQYNEWFVAVFYTSFHLFADLNPIWTKPLQDKNLSRSKVIDSLFVFYV
jgi:hypothetical protein